MANASRADQSSDRANHGDTNATPDNPNAQGPVMRPVAVPTAGSANYPADGHDTYPAPYPRVQRGAVATPGRGKA